MESPLNLRIPGPTPCPAEVLAATAGQMVNHRGPEFAQTLRRVTDGLNWVFGSSSDILSFTTSGTGGLEVAIVNTLSPGDRVLAVSVGSFGDRFGPGKHSLTTDNIPVLTNLRSWKYAFESPFKADVYYVTTRVFPGNKWGTANPVMMRDADFGVVRLRAYGTYDFRIVDVPRFLKEVAGTDHHFRLDEFADTMRSRLVSVFSDALAGSKIPALEVASRYGELGEALLPLINPVLAEKYGLQMTTFVVENVSVPPEVEQAIDKRSSMAAVGNLNDYVKYQMAQGFEKGTSGAGGIGAEMAVGMAMAQQMMNQPGGVLAQSTPGVAAPTGSATAELFTPAQVAQRLGVAESDVIASLEGGDLKGKRIGTQWRMMKAAIADFLK